MSRTAGSKNKVQSDYCPSGHLYTESNIRMMHGRRACRECANARALRSYHRNKVKKPRKR